MTPLGVIVAVLVGVGLLTWTMTKGPTMFSAGPLNAIAKTQPLGGVTTHADLAGNCPACHPAPWNPQTMADRCLACHKDVGTQITGRSGLHGTLLPAGAAPTCLGCHTDHNGATGSLTVFDPVGFPHQSTGFSLRAHQGASNVVTCISCHPQDLTHFDQTTCATCHTQRNATFMSGHVAAFGQQCVPCHDGVDRFERDFNHTTGPFTLIGKHASTPCAQCHTNSSTLQALQQTPQDCYSCHAKDDNHKGAFGRQCGQCHTPNNWTDANFDHTAFPLDHGSREQVATCQTCHPDNVQTYACFGCHRHTPANVQAEHEGRSLTELQDCVSCHAGGRRGD